MANNSQIVLVPLLRFVIDHELTGHSATLPDLNGRAQAKALSTLRVEDLDEFLGILEEKLTSLLLVHPTFRESSLDQPYPTAVSCAQEAPLDTAVNPSPEKVESSGESIMKMMARMPASQGAPPPSTSEG